MKKCLTILAIVIFSIFGSQAKAQVSQPYEEEPKVNLEDFGWVNFGLGLQLSYPMGDYKKAYDKTSVGIGGNIGYQFRDVPLQVGFDGAYMIYGSNTERRPWSSTIPNVYLDVTTNYSFSFGHLYARVQPSQGVIKPYVEGLFGFNYLATTTEVDNSHYDEDENIASTTNFDDFVMSYGLGGGAQIALISFPMDFTTRKGQLLLDLGVKYIFGGEAEYLPDNGLRVENGQVYYSPRKSKTDIVTARIGVELKF